MVSFREKYNLPGFGFGIDGVFLNFDERPRKIPENRIGHGNISQQQQQHGYNNPATTPTRQQQQPGYNNKTATTTT